MARDYARYLVSTHRDADWRALTALHHDTYMATNANEAISWAGVLPYVPAMLVGFNADLTSDRKVERVWAELAEMDYLVIDRTVGEILVRTFIRHDGVISKPNLTKAMITARRKIRSDLIGQSIDRELVKLYRDLPNLSGWKQFREPSRELFPELFDELSREPFKPRIAG